MLEECVSGLTLRDQPGPLVPKRPSEGRARDTATLSTSPKRVLPPTASPAVSYRMPGAAGTPGDREPSGVLRRLPNTNALRSKSCTHRAPGLCATEAAGARPTTDTLSGLPPNTQEYRQHSVAKFNSRILEWERRHVQELSGMDLRGLKNFKISGEIRHEIFRESREKRCNSFALLLKRCLRFI